MNTQNITLGQMIVLVQEAKNRDYNDEYDFFIENGKVIMQKKALELVMLPSHNLQCNIKGGGN